MVMITRRMMEDDWGACGDVGRLFELFGGRDEFELTVENLRVVLRSRDSGMWLGWFQTEVVPEGRRHDLHVALNAIGDTEHGAYLDALADRRARYLHRWAERNWSVLPGVANKAPVPAGYTMAELMKRFAEPIARGGGAEVPPEYRDALRRPPDYNDGDKTDLATARRYLEADTARMINTWPAVGAEASPEQGFVGGQGLLDVMSQLRSMELDRSEAVGLIRLVRERTRR